MYTSYKGGSVEKIEGIDVYVPPVGKVYNPLTDQLEETEILFKALPKKEQYWRRTELPENWKQLRKEEKRRQELDKDYYDEKLEKFRVQEWHRRLCGVWFMNNGKPTYITGLHYFYLNWWKIDIGYPGFRIPDRELFLFVQYCIEDPNCLGLIEVTKRKQGKTFRAGVFVYEYISRTKSAYGGIQSKTLEDARDQVFQKSIVTPFKHLPDFFKPIFDTAQGDTPKTEIRFFHTTRKGKAALEEREDQDEELESVIDFKSSEKHAYDGPKVHRYVGDEVGKTTEVDVQVRHDIVKFCCMVDGEIIGKMYYTTTVEDMESGGQEFAQLFKDSNQHERNANGRTVSGLYRYFLPAYRTMYFDKYGFPDEEKSKAFYKNEREGIKDPAALASYVRKNPFTIEEAFMVDGEKCVFNAMILNDRLSFLNINPNITTRGDFEWENEKDGKVKFVHNDHNGKFEVAWLPPVSDRNKVSEIHSGGVLKYKPQNDAKFCIACDPISHGKTVENRKSNASAYVFRKFDFQADHGKKESEYESHNFVVEYLHRPPEPEIFYEDMIKLCRFFGSQILVENQKNTVLHHFRIRGYEEFIMHRPESTFTKDGDSQDTEGLPSSQIMIDTYTGRLQTFVIKHGHRIKFKRLIMDMLIFDPGKPRKHDCTVAAGFTLLAKEKIVEEDLPPINIEDILNLYDNSGSASTLAG